MAEHQRVAMPFDRARTLLLFGQLERRLRKKESASANLAAALEIFEQHNVPLWADRTRAELARANVGPHASRQLNTIRTARSRARRVDDSPMISP